MKRFKFAVAAICAGLIFCPWAPVVADTAELEPAEADRILYLLEFTRFKQEVLAGENALWDATAFNRLANDHQNHVEMLEELASRYELEDTGKYAGNFDILLLNEALRPQWTNWGSWLFDRHDYCKAGAFLEEMNIRDLRNAIRETQEQILIDTYTAILADGYVHLLVLLHQMYDDPYDYDPRLLSREEVDSALLEASALLSLTFEINAGLNDAWFDPARNGQGLFVSVYEAAGTVFVGWFTYDTDLPAQAGSGLGSPCQRWLTAQGGYTGSVTELNVYSANGGLFDEALPSTGLQDVGTARLEFLDCGAGVFTYDLPQYGLSGSFPIQRVASDNIAACLLRAPISN